MQTQSKRVHGKISRYTVLDEAVVNWRCCCPLRPPWGKLHRLPGGRMRYVINSVTSMTIIGILGWFFVRHLCSAIQETSINVIHSPASVCVCVVPVCERCHRHWQPINPFTVQVQISSGLLLLLLSAAGAAGAAGCLQHHGQRHHHHLHQQQQQQQQQQHGGGETGASAGGNTLKYHLHSSKGSV